MSLFREEKCTRPHLTCPECPFSGVCYAPKRREATDTTRTFGTQMTDDTNKPKEPW